MKRGRIRASPSHWPDVSPQRGMDDVLAVSRRGWDIFPAGGAVLGERAPGHRRHLAPHGRATPVKNALLLTSRALARGMRFGDTRFGTFALTPVPVGFP